MPHTTQTYFDRPQSQRKGVEKGKMRAIYCAFDNDVFEIISKMATENRVSFAEQVRTVVEWGLDTIDTKNE